MIEMDVAYMRVQVRNWQRFFFGIYERKTSSTNVAKSKYCATVL